MVQILSTGYQPKDLHNPAHEVCGSFKSGLFIQAFPINPFVIS